MTKRVRNTTLLLLVVAIGVVSSPMFGQTSKNPSGQILKGKNVTVYLEDADFGILAEKFAYDPSTRIVDIQDVKPEVIPRTFGVFSTAHFVNTNSPLIQPTSLKKMTPRPLGTSQVPKPLVGKPQKSTQEEFSFEVLSQVPSL